MDRAERRNSKSKQSRSDSNRKEQNPERGKDAGPPAREAAPGIIAGIPAPRSDHPRVAIGAGGTILSIADEETVAAYRIQREGGRVSATELWRHDLRHRVCELLPLRGGAFLALTTSDDETRALVLDSEEAPRALATLPGALATAAVAGGRLLAVLRDHASGASLREIELASGRLVAERRLPSADIDIAASRTGTHIAIVERSARAIDLRQANGQTPCPPERPKDEHGKPAAAAPTDCDCPPVHGDPAEKAREREREARQKEHDRENPPRRPCAPGDAAVPDDRGGAIVADGGRIERRPPLTSRDEDPLGKDCWGNLFWKPDRLRWAGAYILATQGNFMRRFALLSPDDLGVVRERSFGRRGALVFATAESDGVIAYHPTRRVFELIEAAIGDSFLDPLDKAPITLPAAEKIFIGQRTLSLSPESAPSLGDLNILVMPVVEPGQAYNEPNLAPVWNFLDGGYFERARQFYEENSFNQLHLKFHMFGHTKGPAGLPLALPAPISTYYWPPFEAGGVVLSRTMPAAGATVAFVGGESITLRVQPRTGSRNPVDLTLRFAAAQFRASHDAFPVKLIIGAGQTGTITARDTNGAVHTLNLAFPAQTIEIKKDDVAGGLAAVETYLDQVIAAAETAAGVPSGRLFAKPKAWRVQRTNLEFGQLHVSLAFAARPPGPAKPAVTLISATATIDAAFGFADTVTGTFALPADAADLADHVTRAMRQAESEVDETVTNPVLADAATVSLSGGLETRIRLSDNDGGPNATITVSSSSNAGELFTTASPFPGSISTKNDANAPRDLDRLFNDVFAAAANRTGTDLSPFHDMHVIMIGFIGAAAGIWNAAPSTAPSNLREAQKTFTAEVATDPKDKKRQLKARWLLAFLDGAPDAPTLCHELGHAIGFRDLYKQTDYRDDLQYLDAWGDDG